MSVVWTLQNSSKQWRVAGKQEITAATKASISVCNVQKSTGL